MIVNCNDALGKVLRAARRHMDLTQEDVAQAMRSVGYTWDRTTVAKVERGKRHLLAAELFDVAPVVGLQLILTQKAD